MAQIKKDPDGIRICSNCNVVVFDMDCCWHCHKPFFLNNIPKLKIAKKRLLVNKVTGQTCTSCSECHTIIKANEESCPGCLSVFDNKEAEIRVIDLREYE